MLLLRIPPKRKVLPFGLAAFLSLLSLSLPPRGAAEAGFKVHPYPLEAQVARILSECRGVKNWKPTGITEDYYARVSEPIVRQAVGWQDATGRIIDPYVRKETPTATPRFVGALAGLILKGRCLDLVDNCRRAVTAAAEDLYFAAEKQVSGPEFYTKELMLGYLALKDRIDEATLSRWRKYLGGFDPEKNYSVVLSKLPPEKLHNYTTFAMAGEGMKKQYGLADNTDFIERHLEAQLAFFTPFGMYRDPQNPMTYDAVPRMNLSLLLHAGYEGKNALVLDEMLRRGALTMLFSMSTSGECPYGGRSNQQNFNEATAALIFEYEAARYKRAGNPELAGVFKRAARLAALSVKRWLDLRPVGFIKNEFPPESQHGRQKGYGYYAAYSLLIASQFGIAGMLADPSIAEKPSPSETGGYVVCLDDNFHKILASCRGYHIEVDTRADLHYDATGLGRFHRSGIPTETALSTPIVSGPEYLVSTAPSPRNIAVGPGWEREGRIRWLSDLSEEIKKVEFTSVLESPERIKFDVSYSGGLDCGVVTERYELDSSGLTITWNVSRPGDALLVQVPLIETDGRQSSQISTSDRGFRVVYRGHVYEAECPSPGKAGFFIEDFVAPNRNAVYRIGCLRTSGGPLTIRFSLK